MNISTWSFDSQRALLFFSLVLSGAVWFHNQVPLGPDTSGIKLLLYDVFYTWYLACCCRCSVASLLFVVAARAAAAVVLLFVIVCQMAKNAAGLLNLIPCTRIFSSD